MLTLACGSEKQLYQETPAIAGLFLCLSVQYTEFMM